MFWIIFEKLTAMNSQSQQSFQLEENVQPTRQPEPGRSRFTLLSDIPETGINKPNLQDSPVRMYLRELHEQRLLLEKENNLKEGNRREAHSECRPDKDRKEMGKPIYEAERVKVEMTSHPNENRDNNMTRIAFDHKKEDVPGRLKPGIYLYRKKINLAEPAQSWSELGESFLRSSYNSRSTHNGDDGQGDQLFAEALRHRNPKRF